MLLLKKFGHCLLDLVFSRTFELNIFDVPLPITWIPATICNPGMILNLVNGKPLLWVLVQQSLDQVYHCVFIPAI